MSRSETSESLGRSGFARAVFSVRQLMLIVFFKPRSQKRKRFAPGDLPPELMRDVGLTDVALSASSLEDKWQLEMKLQTK